MGNVLNCCNLIAFRNLSLIEEDILDRIRNPDLLDLTASIDVESSLCRCRLGLNKGFQNWNLLVLNMAAWLEGKPLAEEF